MKRARRHFASPTRQRPQGQGHNAPGFDQARDRAAEDAAPLRARRRAAQAWALAVADAMEIKPRPLQKFVNRILASGGPSIKARMKHYECAPRALPQVGAAWRGRRSRCPVRSSRFDGPPL